MTSDGWYAIKPKPTKSYIFDKYVVRGFAIKYPTLDTLNQVKLDISY